MVHTYFWLRHEASWRERFLAAATVLELWLIWGSGYVLSWMMKSS